MKILVIGSGGREHAIVWKISQSKKINKIYCIPGNAGISKYAECIDININNFQELVNFSKKNNIDLTIVGIDELLANGIVDIFNNNNLNIFGPKQNSAILESSKLFAKAFMKKYNIPTMNYKSFDNIKEILNYLNSNNINYPVVLKVNGLALGKGVYICNTLKDANEYVKILMIDKRFGSAGNTVIVEEFVTGHEVSILAFTDGKNIKIMSSAQDYKRIKNNNLGLNTGGMGAISPSPFYTKNVDNFCKKYIFEPTINAMRLENRKFIGVIFFGLILTKNGPKILEYNSRFGDPESQVIIPRLKNDIVDIFNSCINGKLNNINLTFDIESTICVVLASNGYPLLYKKGFYIEGLENLNNFENNKKYYIFHAGTTFSNKKIITNGGRVLNIVAKDINFKRAHINVYKIAKLISFDNKYMRNDIGSDVINLF